MIEKALVSRLLEVADVTNKIGSRVYPVQLSQDPVYPALVYELISSGHGESNNGPHNLIQSRFQIDCFADTYEEAKELAQAVRKALRGYKGKLDGVKIWNVTLEDEDDNYDDEIRKWRVIADYLISYRDPDLV